MLGQSAVNNQFDKLRGGSGGEWGGEGGMGENEEGIGAIETFPMQSAGI